MTVSLSNSKIKVFVLESGIAARKMENFVQTRVYISSTMDVKSRVSNWWKKLKLKTAMQHIGLLVILAGYTVAGGWVSGVVSFSEFIEANFTNNLRNAIPNVLRGPLHDEKIFFNHHI